jgi:uncharacterized protein YegP (UPF0339 family)
MFEIYQSDSDSKFHYRLKAANGEIILSGQGYTTKEACQKGVESVKTNASNDGAFHTREAKDGRHYFTVVAANGQVVGQSQMYKSDSGLKTGIASVQSNAPEAEVHDLT